MMGRSAEDAAALLPRLFGLCSAAQGLAMRISLGLPVTASDHDALRREMLRDHLAKLCLRWPALLGLPTRPLPKGWADGTDVPETLLGGSAPPDADGFAEWLTRGRGVAPVLAALTRVFAPGEAAADLPEVQPATILAATAVENSAAMRHANHPVLRAIEASQGRGPLWRAAGRLFDALACATGDLPAPHRLADGTAIVPTARGLYGIRARATDGLVTGFARCTPTGHLCATGGVLERALGTLRSRTPACVALLADILDPCVPVLVREAADA
jgi:hypothetical protein